jgi:hypothetical protein
MCGGRLIALGDSANINAMRMIRVSFGDRIVRVFIIEGRLWFPVADVCALLQIGENNQGLADIEEDEWRQIEWAGETVPVLSDYAIDVLSCFNHSVQRGGITWAVLGSLTSCAWHCFVRATSLSAAGGYPARRCCDHACARRSARLLPRAFAITGAFNLRADAY